MAERRVRAVFVRDGYELAGLFSERDCARKIMLMGKSSVDSPVEDIMSTNIVSLAPDESTDGCMDSMTENRIRHMPVMIDVKLEDIVSIGDVVKAAIA